MTESCTDGTDNDGDALSDCADPDCATLACDDGDDCTFDDACDNSTCVGRAVVCTSPPPCKATPGTCSGGICQYTANVANGSTCDDADSCTQTDTCNNGACIGQSPVVCNSTACNQNGMCNSSTGTCTFTPVTCTPNECQTGGSCNPADGGCEFTARPNGSTCQADAGTCHNGGCTTETAFAYAPSNFSPTTGIVRGPIIIDCPAALNTSNAGSLVTLCGRTVNVDSVSLSGTSYGARIIRTRSLIVTDGGTLAVLGQIPLIFAVYGDADIDGRINASRSIAMSSNENESIYPCNDPTSGNNSGDGRPGAGGGAFADLGGQGGDGSTGSIGGAAGLPVGNATLVPLRGGCDGAPGSGGNNEGFGRGGGAVQVSVAGTLTLRGVILANGAGGHGGNSGASKGGGAGAGSGGGILLEAQRLRMKATLRMTANGGTGGEGAGFNDGQDGVDGLPDFGPTAAPAGQDPSGGNGGDGAGGLTLAGGNGADGTLGESGGGGGGASVGRIRINFNTACREQGYLISPSTAAATGNPNAAFTTNASLPAAVVSCP